MKIIAFTLIGGAAAFNPTAVPRSSGTALYSGPVAGAGGMFDTRDPDAFEHEDPRKSISAAPSFEEYLKQRSGGGGDAPAAPAAAAPAPEPQVGFGGSVKTSNFDGLTSSHPRSDLDHSGETKELPVGFGGCVKTSNFDGLTSSHPRSDLAKPSFTSPPRAPATPDQVRSGVAQTRAATPAQARHFSGGTGTILDDSKPYSYMGTKKAGAGKADLPIGFGGCVKTTNFEGLTSSHPRADVANRHASAATPRPEEVSGDERVDDAIRHGFGHGMNEVVYGPTTSDPHAY